MPGSLSACFGDTFFDFGSEPVVLRCESVREAANDCLYKLRPAAPLEPAAGDRTQRPALRWRGYGSASNNYLNRSATSKLVLCLEIVDFVWRNGFWPLREIHQTGPPPSGF